MNLFYTIITVLAGLGVSLYGFRVLREGMETSLGSSFKRIIGKVANNRFGSYALSAGVSGAWQSTTLTLSMISSFLNVGSITLTQGVALMLGVQLGSALMIVLVAFQSIDLMKILSVLCVVGAFMLMFCKSYKMQKVALSVMGFGLLFAGISLLGDGMSVLVNDPNIYDAISVMTNPILLFVVGGIISMVTNSMYATVTIMIALMGATGGGPLSVMSGVYMLAGASAFGGIVPMLYCINNTSRESKAMLLGYNLYKVFATALLLLSSLIPWLIPFYDLLGHQTAIYLLLLYLITMFVPGLLLLPLSKFLGKLFIKLIPNNKKNVSVYDTFIIDENSTKIFSVALPTLLNNVARIITMQTKLTTKIVHRFEDKLFNDKGIQSEIKGLDKIIKLTNNTAIRLSANVNKDNLDKINIVINILNDANHYLEHINKIYNYGLRFKAKPKKLNNVQVESLKTIWGSIEDLSNNLHKLVENALANNLKVDDKTFNEILLKAQENERENSTARKSLFVPQQKINGDYITYFDVLMAFENINTDLSNITIKIGILTN